MAVMRYARTPARIGSHGGAHWLYRADGEVEAWALASDVDGMRRRFPALGARLDAALDSDDPEALHDVALMLRTARALSKGARIMRGRFIPRGCWTVKRNGHAIVAHDLDVETLRAAGDPAAELDGVLGVVMDRARSRFDAVASRLALDGMDDQRTIREADEARILRMAEGFGAPLSGILAYYEWPVANPRAGVVVDATP